MGHSDYLRPSEQEEKKQKTAQLLVFLQKQLRQEPNERLVKDSQDMYCSKDYTEALAAQIEGISASERGLIFWGSQTKAGLELALWWENYQEEQAKNQQLKAAFDRRRELRIEGLAKLTEEQKEALGLAGLTE